MKGDVYSANTQMKTFVVGQRRVGKSYLLYQLMDDMRHDFPDVDILYINKELYDFDRIKAYTDLIEYVSFMRRSVDDKCYLFIDEIQDIENFEKALRHFFAENTYDIYCTSSNAIMLSGELATHFIMEYLRNIYNTIILKDVVNIYNIRNVRQLQDLTLYLADTIGNLFWANKISDQASTSFLSPLLISFMHKLLDISFLFCKITAK